MENTTQRNISWPRFKQQMEAKGITNQDLADRSGIHRPNISAILNGRQYTGPKRTARLQDAFHELCREQDEAKVKGTVEPTTQPEPRIRRL